MKSVKFVFRTKYNIKQKTVDTDQPAVDEMLGHYEGLRFRDVPSDPRVIDPARIAALRERLSSRYSYRWRGTEANIELAEALFAARRSSGGGIVYLKTATMLQNAAGQSPPVTRSPINWGESEGYYKIYYMTVAISRVANYIHSLDAAEALVRQVLPAAGYRLTWGAGGHRLRLEQGNEVGPWFEGFPAALALVIAMLERLERRPEDAAAWRGPP